MPRMQGIDDDNFGDQCEISNEEDHEFDTYIGALEDVLMNEEFSNAQLQFCEKYCGIRSLIEILRDHLRFHR